MENVVVRADVCRRQQLLEVWGGFMVVVPPPLPPRDAWLAQWGGLGERGCLSKQQGGVQGRSAAEGVRALLPHKGKHLGKRGSGGSDLLYRAMEVERGRLY